MGLQRWWALRSAVFMVGIGAASVVLAGCGEHLDGSTGCPLLCSDLASQIQTVTLDTITIDAALPAALGLGSETQMLLASRGDTLDTRIVVRFDSLPDSAVYSGSSATRSPIDTVLGALLHVRFDSAASSVPVPMTVSVYDIDTSAANDTSAVALAPLFVPARRLGFRTYAAGALADTTTIPISDSAVLAKIRGKKPLRLGLQISAAASASTHMYAVESLLGPILTFRVSADTTVPIAGVAPYSSTPAGDRVLAANESDFTLVVTGTAPPPATYLAVGGIPASRTYLRFNIPDRIVDSSIVVRATLVLTQVPSASPGQIDSMLVQPNAVVAGSVVTDTGRAAQLYSTSVVTMEPLVTYPQSAGTKEIEVAPIFALWALQDKNVFPRAIVLRSGQEFLSPQQALFYSSQAADTAVRPKLRISYTVRARIGTP